MKRQIDPMVTMQIRLKPETVTSLSKISVRYKKPITTVIRHIIEMNIKSYKFAETKIEEHELRIKKLEDWHESNIKQKMAD